MSRSICSGARTPTITRGSGGALARPGHARRRPFQGAVTNRGEVEVDVSVLFIDRGYGIRPYFPEDGTVLDDRIPREKSATGFRKRLGTQTLGKERMLVLVTQAKGNPVSFTGFAQPTLERARGVFPRPNRGGGDVQSGPLGKDPPPGDVPRGDDSQHGRRRRGGDHRSNHHLDDRQSAPGPVPPSSRSINREPPSGHERYRSPGALTIA